MRWRGGRRSNNVEDRRGTSPGYSAAGAGGMMLLRLLPMMLRSKVGRVVLILGVVVVLGGKFLGIDLLPMLLGGGSATVQSPASFPPKNSSSRILCRSCWRIPKTAGE